MTRGSGGVGASIDLVAAPPVPIGSVGFVERTRLLRRLLEVPPGTCVCIVAPGGYGKTTLLRQWESLDARPAVRVDLDRDDNDPVVLLDHLATALATIGSDDASDMGASAPHGRSSGGLNRVRRALRAFDPDQPAVLLIDHADVIHRRPARDVLTTLVRDVPPGIVLALASRSDPPGGTGLLRSTGTLVEIRTSDLALDRGEVEQLVQGLGLEGRAAFDDVIERTEGWPVAVYLSVLAVTSSGRPPAEAVGRSASFVAEYLDESILSRVSPGRREFLLRSSVLDRMSGPLCDVVLETEGSAGRLASLEAANLLVESLDPSKTWFRYHPLFAEHLRAEFERSAPELVDGLHRRAAQWFSDHDMPVWAIHHAQEAGDAAFAATLVATHARSQFNASRFDTVVDWFAWFDEQDPFPAIPGLAATGALAFAWIGDVARAERWRERALAAPGDGASDVLSRLVRGFCCPVDLAEMIEDAAAAVDGLPADSDWHAAALALDGFARMLAGDAPAASDALVSAIAHGESYQALMAAATAHALIAATAVEIGDWQTASRHADEAMADVGTANLGQLVTGCLSFAVAARVEEHAGRVSSAQTLVRRASVARAATTEATPIVSTFALIQLARAHLELGDVAGARQITREAIHMLGTRSRFGHLDADLDRLTGQLAELPAGVIGASSLTAAEMRLLPHLATHLTFGEIADRLYVSRHTVKTQAMSVYRKLEVSSRGEAVDRSREAGLLPG